MILIAAMIFVLFMTGCSDKNTDNHSKEPLNNEDKDNNENPLVSEYGVEIKENSVIFTDSMDKKVEVKKNPKKVIILQNSLLDIWDSCGGTVVGRLEYTEEKPVENAKSAEVVGTVGTPSLEKILSLEPDLVMILSDYNSHKEMIPVLEQSNIQVVAFNDDVRADYYRTLRIFSALTDREDLYKDIISVVKDEVEKIIAKAPTDKNYKAIILRATSKAIAARDSNTMVGEMLKDLNVTNIADSMSESQDTKTFSMEKLIQEDPDFIFVITMGSDMEKIKERLKSEVESNPAWTSLKAVKGDRYIVLPKDLYMYKPNIRYAEAYENLAKILYPEVFK